MRGEGLVRGQNDRRALGLFDHLGHRIGLAGAGGPQQHLILLAAEHALGQFRNRLWLISRRLKRRLHDKPAPAFKLWLGQHLGARGDGIGIVMRHG